MKRHEWNFSIWCTTATQQICYKPDRKRVAAELRAHLDDAFDAHIARGLTPEEAEEKALASMGSATELAPQLAAIYKPFWGYVLQASQILLVILLVLSLIPIGKYAITVAYNCANRQTILDRHFIVEASDQDGLTLHHQSKPDVSFRSHGNKFTVTEAVLYTEYSEYQQRDITRLNFLVQQTSLLPWTEHTQFYSYESVVCQFFIRDDKGNEYALAHDSSRTTTYGQSGVFSATHVCWINDFPADAKWAELCYEQDGQCFALRISLTGGDRT